MPKDGGDRDESNFLWNRIYLEALPCLYFKLKGKGIHMIDLVPLRLLFLSQRLFRFLIHKELR